MKLFIDDVPTFQLLHASASHQIEFSSYKEAFFPALKEWT
jgi:hypothetical protein